MNYQLGNDIPIEWNEHHKPDTAHMADGSDDPDVADVRPWIPGVSAGLRKLTNLEKYIICYQSDLKN